MTDAIKTADQHQLAYLKELRIELQKIYGQGVLEQHFFTVAFIKEGSTEKAEKFIILLKSISNGKKAFVLIEKSVIFNTAEGQSNSNI